MKVGDLVRYVRAIPEEAHLIYEVSAIMEDDDGAWIMLTEDDPGWRWHCGRFRRLGRGSRVWGDK